MRIFCRDIKEKVILSIPFERKIKLSPRRVSRGSTKSTKTRILEKIGVDGRILIK